MSKCYKSVEMGLCGLEHGHAGPCSRGDALSATEPPDPWDGVPFGPRPDLPGWGGGWAHPELRRRLEALEQRLADSTSEFLAKLRDAGVTRYRRGDLEIELAPAAAAVPVDIPVRELMRAWPRAEVPEQLGEQLGKVVREAGYPQRVPSGIVYCKANQCENWWPDGREDGPITARLGYCKTPVGLQDWRNERSLCPGGFAPKQNSHTGPCSRGDAPPAPEPPDERPVVEIDYAATEELLRAQDARRRGTG